MRSDMKLSINYINMHNWIVADAWRASDGMPWINIRRTFWYFATCKLTTNNDIKHEIKSKQDQHNFADVNEMIAIHRQYIRTHAHKLHLLFRCWILTRNNIRTEFNYEHMFRWSMQHIHTRGNIFCVGVCFDSVFRSLFKFIWMERFYSLWPMEFNQWKWFVEIFNLKFVEK